MALSESMGQLSGYQHNAPLAEGWSRGYHARFARGAADCVRPYVRLFGREILFFQDAAVVEFVAGGDIAESADGYFLLVGDAAAGPGLLVEIPQQGQRGAPDGDVVFDDFGKRHPGSVADIVILLETFDGRAISARDVESPIGEDALGIANMPEYFLDRPLLGCVAKIGVRLVTTGEQQ